MRRFEEAVRSWVPPLLVGSVALVVLWRGPFVHGTVGLPTVLVEGREVPETCLRCHQDTQGLGSAHDPAAVGCSACHLGDPSALREDQAHRGMHVIAGNLAIARDTCGRSGCHPDEVSRVDRSIMAGAPGILAVNRFTFGERDAPRVEPEDDLRTLAGREANSPAESHVRKLCASCHIGLPKTEVGDHGFASRGGGCTACHLNPPTLQGDSVGRLHPDVSADVRQRRCEGCHARSGRISLSFQGKVELEPNDPRVDGTLPDGRPTGTAPADVHAQAGFTCFDCHTERGLMGDGRVVGHSYEAVDIRCEDCHRPEASAPASPEQAARVANVLRASWRRRGGPELTGEPLRTQRGTPLWRTDKATARQWLHETGAALEVPEARDEPYHRLRGHERLSCQACHTSWAPRCTQCHTQYEPLERQFDHIAKEETPGAWHEVAGGNGMGAPLLALGPTGKIQPFVEGMTLTVEGLAKPVRRKLWAPLDPHTTGASRLCGDCHPTNDLDAVYPTAGETTRVGARLLSDEELGRIRRVSACLPCHDRYEDPVFVDFGASVMRLASQRNALVGDPVKSCTGPTD